MTRVCAVLTLLLVLSALLLVTSQYRATRLTTAVERAQGQGRELDVHERQLKLSIAERAREYRIDAKARQDLKMISMSPERLISARELK